MLEGFSATWQWHEMALILSGIQEILSRLCNFYMIFLEGKGVFLAYLEGALGLLKKKKPYS